MMKDFTSDGGINMVELKTYQAQYHHQHKIYPVGEIPLYETYAFKAKDDSEALFLGLKFAAKRKEEDKNYVVYTLTGVREVRNVPLKYEYFNDNPENIEKRIEEAGFQHVC